MKIPKYLDQVVDTTKKLPLEMDIARVDALVATFPNQAPPSGGFRAPHLLTLMAVALAAALLLLLLPRHPDGPPPRLAAAFPLADEERPGTPVMLPVVPEPAATEAGPRPPAVVAPITAPPAVLDTRVVPAPAPQTTIAPAPPPPETLHGRAPKAHPKPITPPFGEPTVTGTYSVISPGKQHGRSIILESVERVNGRKITWMLPLGLAGEEQRIWADMPARGAYLERETGRILVKPAGRTGGTFTFQPHLPVQQHYEQRGWGTTQVPAQDVTLVGMQQGVSLRPEVATNTPADITWLRYFTNHVGDRYLVALGELGVPKSEWEQLWRLPNASVSLGDLHSLNQLLDRLLYVRDGGLTVETVVVLNGKRALLRELHRQGYTGLTGTEVGTLIAADVSDYYLTRINLYRNGNFSPLEIGTLAAAGVSTHDANKFHQAFGRDLTVRELTDLHAAAVSSYSATVFFALDLGGITPAELIAAEASGFTPYDVRRMQENGLNLSTLSDYLAAARKQITDETVTDRAADGEAGVFLVRKDFARKQRNWKRKNIELAPFSRLRVEGELKVVVIPGAAFRAEVLHPDFDGLSIDLAVNDKGELRISKRVKVGWAIKLKTAAEIRLTVPTLEAVKTRKNARVWIMEGMPAVEGAGRALEDR